MLYIAKAADVAAAQEMVAAWATHHAEYYGTIIGSRLIPRGKWCAGIVILPAWQEISDDVRFGYTGRGPTHQWVRSSGTIVQVDFLPDDVVLLCLKGRRHSVAEMNWPGNALRRLVASVTHVVAYDTQQPKWGPLDTADTHHATTA